MLTVDLVDLNVGSDHLRGLHRHHAGAEDPQDSLSSLV